MGVNEGLDHYQDTIARSRSIDEIESDLTGQKIADLREIYDDGQFWVWGIAPNPEKSPWNDKKVNSWRRLAPGEPVLFSWSREFRAVANVTYKIHNESAAEYLWDRKKDPDKPDVTWEYMFFLDEPRQFRLPCEDFNRVVGYDLGYFPQGLNRMNEEASTLAFAEFDFQSDRALAPVSDEDFENPVDKLQNLGKLDVERASYSRVEQQRIRQYWFQSSDVVSCGICRNRFPTELLIAPHIKKRSACSREEKLDYTNNTMPLCALGCDELFERGYLAVDDGFVVERLNRPKSHSVEQYCRTISGNTCSYWSEDSEVYFRWHRRYHSAT